MRDLVFAGGDVEAALATAARDLGLPRERLRYVVLDPGRPERLGVKGQPARVAILLEKPQGRTGPRDSRPEPAVSRPPRPPATVAWLVGKLAEEAGLELQALEEETGDGKVLRLQGSGAAVLLGQGGGELLSALEHLLRAAVAADSPAGRFRMECEGYREWRDMELQQRARTLAEAVANDGQPRHTEPLNSYERRLVHLAVSEIPGLTTRSEGEGAGRYVVITPAAGTAGEPHPSGS